MGETDKAYIETYSMVTSALGSPVDVISCIWKMWRNAGDKSFHRGESLNQNMKGFKIFLLSLACPLSFPVELVTVL